MAAVGEKRFQRRGPRDRGMDWVQGGNRRHVLARQKDRLEEREPKGQRVTGRLRDEKREGDGTETRLKSGIEQRDNRA